MSTGTMRAARRELHVEAWRAPLARAPQGVGPADEKHFRKINREITWGLTLNK